MATPFVQAVATAVPDVQLTQAYARDFAAGLFAERYRNIDRLLPIFNNTLIETRHLAQPTSWYTKQQSFVDANAIYQQVALDISLTAAQRAMAQAKVAPEEIGAVVFVSTTGIATPSLDSNIIQCLGLSRHTRRVPVWGLGCAGGVAGLARAADLARVQPGKSVLLIATELCTITFQHGDLTKSNLVATALFGDGAAAVLVRCDEDSDAQPRLDLLDSFSTLFDNSADVMGWELIETGLKVRFARSIPAIVDKYLPDIMTDACNSWGVEVDAALTHFVAHPGGAKVLESYANSLGLTRVQLAQSYEVLANYGNMSSPTVLFVLEQFMREVEPSGNHGTMLALGPGFSAEQILFRW